jgi:hypothetical protein
LKVTLKRFGNFSNKIQETVGKETFFFEQKMGREKRRGEKSVEEGRRDESRNLS